MLVDLAKDSLSTVLSIFQDLIVIILDILCNSKNRKRGLNSLFIYLCQILLVTVDIVCNFLYPAYETLFFLAKFRRKETYNAKFTHWTTYWIFYSVLNYIARLLYFFPFIYEIKVMIVLLMAHPKVEAASLIQ